MQGQLVAGRYRLGESIGNGGMGRVWRAHDEVLHRSVAIKELTAALYVSDSEQAMLLARTRAEARAAARINHSAVVTVHDVLEHDGRPWIVMELVEGRSLADAVKEQGRVEPREAARIGLWVLRALGAAHRAGVLHRDVKPGNVLLGRDGRVLLTDFGIAQIEGDTAITRTGEVVGSVDYLAPERVRGHDPGPASDLWALGATLYTAVEGTSPFRRTSPLTTMQAVVEEEVDAPRHAGPLTPVITALLSKDPAARPDAVRAEEMLAQAAEGRRPDAAQAYVPTRPVATPGPQRHETRPDTALPAGSSGSGPGSGPGFGAASAATAGAQGAGPGAGAPHGTGPTAVQPSGAPGAATPRSAGGGGRRRMIALVVALAAIIGGTTAVVLQQRGDGSRPGGGGTSAASSASPAVEDPEDEGSKSGLPAGWVRRKDPYGFSVVLPGADWKRVVLDGENRQVDYTPDGGKHFLRIAVDDSPDFDDPYEHLGDLDQQIGQRLVDYRRVELRRLVYRDRDSARLEYTWTALPKDTEFPGPYRAIDQMYLARDGVEYALYMAGPAEDWDTTRAQFETVLKGWRER
ncbi:serine/threonine protein kinase [Streptomyces sp. H28]|uniref:serine/threonine-protein kinase n=1 Tax=Streptomyces sp. H28 TaxID=2775865 RepID=UPI001786642B|nr:serine/threonine-protein kinase [Streptomyces sp. H28]MBD9734651.1 serine/threonine protein kinase [Streptomyces sp. H28]